MRTTKEQRDWLFKAPASMSWGATRDLIADLEDALEALETERHFRQEDFDRAEKCRVENERLRKTLGDSIVLMENKIGPVGEGCLCGDCAILRNAHAVLNEKP